MKTVFIKTSLVLAFLAIFGTVSYGDDPAGIKFFTGSWKEVLAEAKKQQKPVFVDIYTTWCGPCKTMAKQAFPDAKVGEKFNANFISYQIDAEKGEGVGVAKKYAVSAYPTSLYISADGDLIHRAIGYGGIKGMLDEADKAIEAFKDPNPLSVLEKQYEGGKRDPEFLATYLQKRANVQMPNGEALTAYLKSIPEAEWNSEKNGLLIAGNATTYNAKVMDLLLIKLRQLKGATSEQDIMQRNQFGQSIFRLNQAHFAEAVAQKNEQMMADVIKTNQLYFEESLGRTLSTNQAEEMAVGDRMRFYLETRNYEKYKLLAKMQADKFLQLSAADIDKLNETAYKNFEEETRSMPDSTKQSEHFKQYAASMKKSEPRQTAMKLNNLAWAYYENITDKKALSQALTWSAKSLKYDRTGMYLDTYAHLLSKLGRKAEAIKAQQEAIANEKAAGRETIVYEKELAKMKAK